ncbi:hypothetical protein A2U01_0109706 [Trifolium medium]|uniref:Uncharacterized protein n=1 Tax=Trifolium medium TaxID=97028 RepID=A0A392VM02_9FABA|nr:hypothetical protein [Trifolium medium]
MEKRRRREVSLGSELVGGFLRKLKDGFAEMELEVQLRMEKKGGL